MNRPAQTQETPLRADARRNRALILEAADSAFSEVGLGVPVDEIARRAGVGAGTLYRHFPTKDALFSAVVVHHVESLAEEGEALAANASPETALFEFLAVLAARAAAKRNLMEALAGAGVDFKASADTAKMRVDTVLALLLDMAQAAGAVRPDVTTTDLFGLVMGTCMLSGHDVDEAGRLRMLSVICTGLRTAGAG